MVKNSFCINTNCCAVQRNETYRIAKFFFNNGWYETQNVRDAELNIITTCGVTNDTEKEALDLIERVEAEKDEKSKIIISGCLPNISADVIKRKFPDAMCIAFDKMKLFDDVIKASLSIENIHYNAEPNFHHSIGDPRIKSDKYVGDERVATTLDEKFNTDKFSEAFKYNTQGKYLWKDNKIFEIKISSGCKNTCSYCASRLGIGQYRSKKVDFILDEFKEGIERGFRQFMLMGDELGAYGEDIDSSLIELIKLMIQMKPDVRLGIRYIYPDYLIDIYSQLKKFMNNVFFICVSIQSASAHVLHDMNRKDSIAILEKVLLDIRDTYRSTYLHTQIIVGFPTESDDDFDKTLCFLDRCRFDYIRYNVFSKRPGTEAAEFQYVYNEETLKERINRMKLFCKHNRYENLYERYKYIIEQLN